MTDQRKPPGKAPPKALLDELSSIHSLLGDGHQDVLPSSLLDDDVPLLEPADPAEGDTQAQKSLFDAPGKPASDEEPLRKMLAGRDNPFLPRKPATPPPAVPKIEPARPTPSPAPNDAALRALVDEALAEWMPKIERDLRNRLMELLRNKS
jgi:hypothetical protein